MPTHWLDLHLITQYYQEDEDVRIFTHRQATPLIKLPLTKCMAQDYWWRTLVANSVISAIDVVGGVGVTPSRLSWLSYHQGSNLESPDVMDQHLDGEVRFYFRK